MNIYILIISIIVLVLLLLILIDIIIYNKLVLLRNQVNNQWSQIDVQLKKRFDLVPNLVEIVKGYAKHEKETLDSVIKARTNVQKAKTVDEEIKSNKKLNSCLVSLMALSETYPDLKADSHFKELQQELVNIEDSISYARQFYNDIVLKYNNAVKIFPNMIVASLFGFVEAHYFEIDEDERNNKEVHV